MLAFFLTKSEVIEDVTFFSVQRLISYSVLKRDSSTSRSLAPAHLILYVVLEDV